MKKNIYNNIIKKYKFNIVPLIFFIIIEILPINTLWNESIYRRILHHIQNNYDKNKIPWIRTCKNVLPKNDLIKCIKINCDNTQNGCNNLNTKSWLLSSATNSIYSKKSTIYFHEFDNDTKKYLVALGNKIKHRYEKLCGEKLVLSNSKDFKAILLQYEGELANFPMHYDSELSHYYRTLILIKKSGTCPKFIYYDKNGQKQKVDLELNEAIFFKGSRTYHGVEQTNDPNTIRYVLGFQYLPKNKVNSPIPKSICTELSGFKINEILYKIRPNIIIIVVLSIISYILGYNYKINVSTSLYLLICFIIIFTSFFLPNLLPSYIGTNRNINLKILFTYIVITIILLLRFDLTVIGFVSYILLTEMIVPSFIIKKTINNGGSI